MSAGHNEHLTSTTAVPTWMVKLATWFVGGLGCFAGGVVLIVLARTFELGDKQNAADIRISQVFTELQTLQASDRKQTEQMEWLVTWAKARPKP